MTQEHDELEASLARDLDETKRMEAVNKKMKKNRTEMNKAVVQFKCDMISAHYKMINDETNELRAKISADEVAAFAQKTTKYLVDLENTEQVKNVRKEEKSVQKANEDLDSSKAEVEQLKKQIIQHQNKHQKNEQKLIIEMVQASAEFNKIHKKVCLRLVLVKIKNK